MRPSGFSPGATNIYQDAISHHTAACHQKMRKIFFKWDFPHFTIRIKLYKSV
jgi:hypothetical protein